MTSTFITVCAFVLALAQPLLGGLPRRRFATRFGASGGEQMGGSSRRSVLPSSRR